MSKRYSRIDRLLFEGTLAMRKGQHRESALYFRQALALEPRLERAWWLLSRVCDTNQERRVCLENVLGINPDNRRAMTALSGLRTDFADIEIDENSPVPKAEPKRFTSGGTVNHKRSVYISREADRVLYENCISNKFSYVLTARQRGKSSLMMRTAERLKENGVLSARVDINRIGAELQSLESFYVSVLAEIVRDLKLKLDVGTWWRDEKHVLLTPVKRFEAFLHDVLLETISEPLVIFIDEIDAVRKIRRNFNTDDFFALIRSMHNASAEDSLYQRLTFVLLGVARPDDLISDKDRTPFNIGENVETADFTFEEAKGMARFIGLPIPYAEQVLTWALEWTNGHPYLTQRLMQKNAEKASQSRTEIEELVRKTFIVSVETDSNLKFVGTMLTPDRIEIGSKALEMYYRIYSGRPVFEDDEDILAVEQLKLSGLVEVIPHYVGQRLERGLIVIRNRIYEAFFDLEWIDDTLLKRYTISRNILETRLRQDEIYDDDNEPLPEPYPIVPLVTVQMPADSAANLSTFSTVDDLDFSGILTQDSNTAPSQQHRTGFERTSTRLPNLSIETNQYDIDSSGESKSAAMVQEAVNRIIKGFEAQGRELLESALRINPYNASAWMWLARVSADSAKKMLCLRNVLAIDPYQGGKRFTGDVSVKAAEMLQEMTGHPWITLIPKLLPPIAADAPPTPENQSLLTIAIDALRSGDKLTATVRLSELLSRQNNVAQAWLLLAQALDSADEQRVCLENALALRPNEPLALKLFAKLPPPTSPLPESQPFSFYRPQPYADAYNAEYYVQQGIRELRQGNKVSAREKFLRATELDDHNEQAWLWLSGVVDTDDEKRICLENVLVINPDNVLAKRGLELLAPSPPTSTPFAKASTDTLVFGDSNSGTPKSTDIDDIVNALLNPSPKPTDNPFDAFADDDDTPFGAPSSAAPKPTDNPFDAFADDDDTPFGAPSSAPPKPTDNPFDVFADDDTPFSASSSAAPKPTGDFDDDFFFDDDTSSTRGVPRFSPSSTRSDFDDDFNFDDDLFGDDRSFSTGRYDDTLFDDDLDFGGFDDELSADVADAPTGQKQTFVTYPKQARRWLDEAERAASPSDNDSENFRPFSATDTLMLYLWFAKSEARGSAFDLARELGIGNTKNGILLMLSGMSLYQALRKPWEVGQAYRSLAQAKRISQSQPGRAKRILWRAFKKYPAVLEDENVDALFMRLLEKESTDSNPFSSGELSTLIETLDEWETASLADDKSVLPEQREWLQKAKNQRIVWLVMIVTLTLVLALIVAPLLSNALLIIFTVANALLIISISILGNMR